MEQNNLHIAYHNNEYGFPIADDDALFGRLILEINQAGLSWSTILKKKDNFYAAFDNFNIGRVASYSSTKVHELMNNAGIIRNRLKIEATIENAKRIKKLQREFGSFKNWLDKHHPLTKDEWVHLFKVTFRFTGGEIVGEFLMSTGYLPFAHSKSCPIYKKVIDANPPWLIMHK